MPGGVVRIPVEPDVRGFPRQLESGLRSSVGVAGIAGRAIGVAVAAGIGVASVGIGAAIKLGIDYTSTLNELQAVSGATGAQMVAVGNAARALGSDLSLPATSGADAAAVMLELTKGGLTLAESMEAARGTIQLAAAAQIEGAAAAEIQSAAINQFGLQASDATLVADTLANTANAASGSITDVALALKYVGPVAASVGISIQDTATAVGLLANNGIQADSAGTALRGMLASLAAPSKPAAAALTELGVVAFDSQGRFVGLRTVIEQLTAAQGRMTDEQFASAAATAFGREPLSAIVALASGGASAFDEMAVAVNRQGGAADVAAAKTQGLGGALDKLRSQAEDAGLGIYESIAPYLERLVLAAASFVGDFGSTVEKGLATGVAVAEVYGPRLAEAIRSRGAVVADAARDILAPLARAGVGPLNELINTSIELFDDFTDVLDNTVAAVRPVATGVAAVVREAGDGAGVVGAFGAAVGVAGDVLKLASSILVPIGQLLGALVQGFSELPGPVQTAVIALVAFRVAQQALGNTTALSGLRQFSGEMAVQRQLAAQNGEEIGRLGSAMAAYRTSTVPAVAAAREFGDQATAIRAGAAAAGEPIGRMSAALGTLVERSPALSAMASSFDQASAGATRFGTAAGAAAAGGTALRLGASGLVAALGGPFGIAIAGAAIGLSLLGASQQEAAQDAARHRSAVDSLASALRDSNGAITENIRMMATKRLQDEGAADLARDLRIPIDVLTDAYLGNRDALGQVNGAIDSYLKAIEGQGQLEGQVAGQNPMADKAQELREQLSGLLPEYTAAQQKNAELEAALKSGSASMVDATDAGRSFGAAMEVLADSTASADEKARALKDAMDALSGGQITLEAAQSKLNEQLARLGEAFGDNVDKTKGWGDALIRADGSINTTVANGRTLFESLQDISAGTADVAQKTYDMAIAQGESVPSALAKATSAAASARDAFVAQAAQLGLTSEQAEMLADRYELIPSTLSTLIQAPGMSDTQQELIVLKALVDRVPPDKPITVRSLSDEAKAKLIDLGYTVTTTPNNVTITANSDRARNELAAFLATPATKTVNIVYHDPGTGAGAPKPGQAAYSHDGNLFAAAYAAGGVHRLTPMRGGVATIVPPNTWRIVGDRLVDDEAYIPINRSQRSVSLLMETARRMGFEVARRFAVGGFANAGASAVTSATGLAPQINNTYVVRNDQTAYEIGQVTTAQQAWQLRTL
jgi:TP901 family phage tail tape measure protein